MLRQIARRTISSLPWAVAAVVVGSALPAQVSSPRSHATGLFAGAGLEADGLSTNDGTMAGDSGSGLGIVLGYGFTPRWSLYSGFSSGRLRGGGRQYVLRHLDAGTRVHFRAGPHAIVPFVQAAVGLRSVSGSADGPSLSGNSMAVEFGGGINLHVTPAYALSGMVTWATGNVDDASRRVVGTVTPSIGTVRAHFGVVWYAH